MDTDDYHGAIKEVREMLYLLAPRTATIAEIEEITDKTVTDIAELWGRHRE